MRKRRSRAAENLLTAVLSAAAGSAALFAVILLIGFVITKVDVGDRVLSVLTSAALAVGAYVGGYVASRRRRQNGLLMGLLCGLGVFGVIFVCSYVFAGAAGGFSATTKLVISLVSAGMGGIVGVNSGGTRFRLK
ncbi:putative membrane protein, TIGR04086 family [Ruminococcus sp. YE71]|uniref:TIGR04086 family membrane protein n=1 Tax=unclassified Ruminococcus TaxID=2608920 RepID=UPI00088B44E3|nr:MULTISPECIES: TIGR04086 family membrane protein [unclassified Ruminococcus]SDA17108.1 putative membrane protein, TIGR04086 family [Ruminococcus sp. YE78]SFW26194.1 putative membrane protein, TIGR04086 family [Ruminococcus sp. YE71]